VKSGSVQSGTGVTVSFAKHFANSGAFDQVFREGMALVEATANYLEGPGRKESKSIGPAASLVYASESMRLTTRLLELASWLVIRRSLKSGEISVEEAQLKRRRLRLASIGRPPHVNGYSQLPEKLRELIEQSFSLHDRIVLLDRALERPEAVVTQVSANPVADQVDLLSAAFTQPPRAAAG